MGCPKLTYIEDFDIEYRTTRYSHLSIIEVSTQEKKHSQHTQTQSFFEKNENVDGDYRYGFNGMEKDDEVKGSGNSYDFGARMYDSRLGRWLSIDGFSDKYSSLSPYSFAGDRPIDAYDPDGNLIIFINGYNYTQAVVSLGVSEATPGWSKGISGIAAKGVDVAQKSNNFASKSTPGIPSPNYGLTKSSYWQGFDVSVSKKWKDNNVSYVDGSPGWVVKNLHDQMRLSEGLQQGKDAAQGTLNALDEGETIKIVTHSMGGAFGRGYAKGMKKEMETIVNEHNLKVGVAKLKAYWNGDDYTGEDYMIMPEFEIVVDIAPWFGQGEPIPALEGVDTYQIDGDNDGISEGELAPGAARISTEKGTGHGIGEYDAKKIPNVKASADDTSN